MVAFLRYWLIFTLTLIATFISTKIGLFQYIYENDPSFITFGIIAIFVIMMLICGVNTYKFFKTDFEFVDELDNYENKTQMGFFIADMLFNLGLLGTVIGFMMMVNGFKQIDPNNTETIKNLIGNLGGGLGTALITTCGGLICGSILKLMYYSLGYEVTKTQNNLYGEP